MGLVRSALIFLLVPGVTLMALPVRAQVPAAAPASAIGATQSAAIDQARLRRDAETPWTEDDESGNAQLGGEATSTGDDSLGAQVILKTQERLKPWRLSGGASFVFTDNAALTRVATQSDVFGVLDAGLGYVTRLSPTVEADLGARASLFRYADLSALDFNSFGFGAGVTWSPARYPGVSLLARYDFAELVSKDFDQILMDHTFTLGAQKTFAFGRSHSLAMGVIGMADISDPAAAARSQAGMFFSYRLQLARRLESTFLLRPAAHFYTDSGRTDFNQIISSNLRYSITERFEANGFLSYGMNRSDRRIFDYEAFTTGAGLGFTLRF